MNAPFGTSNIQVDYSTSLRPSTAQQDKKTPEISQVFQNVPAGVPSWPGYQWKTQTASQNSGRRENPQEILTQIREKIKAR